MGSISTAAVFGPIAALDGLDVAVRHGDEARGERTVVVVRDRVVGERDDGGGAAVEVAAATMISAESTATPLTS